MPSLADAGGAVAAEPHAEGRDDWDSHWCHYAPATEINPAEIMRSRVVLRMLRLPRAGGRVIDIGSGQGDMAKHIRRASPGSQVIGLELSAYGVQVASTKVPGARFLQTDLLKGDPPPAELVSFADHAVCSEVLEHVDEPDRLLRGALPYLAPGCRIVITVPGGPMSAFDHHIGHRRHFGPDSLRAVVEAAGLEILDVRRVGFPWFNVYRLLVVARGEKLVDEVSQRGTGASSSWAARMAMQAFRALFRLNLPRSPWGWQMVCVARLPERG